MLVFEMAFMFPPHLSLHGVQFQWVPLVQLTLFPLAPAMKSFPLPLSLREAERIEAEINWKPVSDFPLLFLHRPFLCVISFTV